MKWSYGMQMRFFHFCILLSISFKNQKSNNNSKIWPITSRMYASEKTGSLLAVIDGADASKKPDTRLVNDSELSSPNNSPATSSKIVQASSMTAAVAFCIVVDGAIPFPCTHGRLPISRFPPIIRLPAAQWGSLEKKNFKNLA